MTRCAARAACSSVATPASSTTNLSPPWRHTSRSGAFPREGPAASSTRRTRVSRCATMRRSSSPTAWPSVSLMRLNWSRSRNSSANDADVREAKSSVSTSRSWKRARSGSSVSTSMYASGWTSRIASARSVASWTVPTTQLALPSAIPTASPIMRTCRNSPLRVLTRASRPGAVVPRVRLTSQRRKARRSSAWTCGSSVAGVAARRSVSIPSMRWSSAEQTTRFVARSHSQLPTRAMRWARFRCRATRRLPRPASWAALRAAFNSSTRSSVRACNRSRRSARSCEGSDAAGKVGPSSGAPDSNWRMAPRSRRRSRACECMSHPTAALGTTTVPSA